VHPTEHIVAIGSHAVNSPMVGTFYRSPSPESPTFVEVGTQVTRGQTLCIIEAMKLMNEIESDVDGIVEKIFVQNGSPVEFNQPLFEIKPL
jgi:acetyl-CoA carboxylase biotin carboxyl carrier protein